MALRLVVDNLVADDLALREKCPTSDFIKAAIQAAQHSNATTRQRVVQDVCEVLNCQTDELLFLFQGEERIDLDKVLMVPDYRLNPEDGQLEAAE